MSALYAIGPALGWVTHLSGLASGARTWSVAVLVVGCSTWLRRGEHLGDDAFATACTAALVAVGARSVGAAWAGRRPGQAPGAEVTDPKIGR